MKVKLNWSEETPAANGQMVSTATPTKEFWTLWREKKAEVKSAGYSVSKVDEAWVVSRYKDNIEAIHDSQAVSNEDIEIPVPEGLSYFPFQKAGVAYALKRDATCIADEMGLGKTIQAIAVINATNPDTVLVVCPASLKENWSREMETWLTADRQIKIVSGGSDKIPDDVDIAIVNYDLLKKNEEAILGSEWGLAILDEAHYIKNPKSQRSKVAVNIKAKRKIALTGTPISNRPIELQPIAGWLAPKAFGNFFKFGLRYAGAYRARFGWNFDGASNLDELQRVLRQSIMVRRKKTEVMKELPAKTRQIIVLPRDKYIDEIQKEYESLAEAVSETTSVDVAFEKMSGVRHRTSLAKVPDVVAHVAKIDHQVVVFAHHKDVIDGIKSGLESAGKSVVTLTGDCDEDHRNRSIDRFQSMKADVFLGTIGAAGVGITLTAASHVIMAELSWVPGQVSQAEDRCHRISQKDNVLVQHLVVNGTLDARLAEVLVQKQKVLDAALDDAVVNEVISLEDLASDIKMKKQPKPLPKKTVQTLKDLLSAVVTRCDRAVELDGSGFNRLDTELGHSLAYIEKWTPAQQHAAKKMLKKYRKQIEQSGLADDYLSVYG